MNPRRSNYSKVLPTTRRIFISKFDDVGLVDSLLPNFMTTKETIESRRSVKHFDPNHVMPEADLAELIRLTKLAPSSFNMQNYRLVVIRDKERQKQIRAAAWDQAHVEGASALFIMCADVESHLTDPATYWSHAPSTRSGHSRPHDQTLLRRKGPIDPRRKYPFVRPRRHDPHARRS